MCPASPQGSAAPAPAFTLTSSPEQFLSLEILEAAKEGGKLEDRLQEVLQLVQARLDLTP